MRIMAEVNKKAERKPTGFQVIQHLRSMVVHEFGDCLQFNDDFVVADKIRKIFLGENSASIIE